MLNSIKMALKDKTVGTAVSEAKDETEYLLGSETNKKMLEGSMQQLKDGKGVTFTVEEFKKRYRA